jgi:hypothetical protein
MYHIFSNRNGVLYFRYRVPVSVKKYFPRLQSSYNRSLRTAYRQEAKIRALILYADIHTRLEKAMKLVDQLREKIRILEEFAPKEND